MKNHKIACRTEIFSSFFVVVLFAFKKKEGKKEKQNQER